jgi:hypothetical protein
MATLDLNGLNTRQLVAMADTLLKGGAVGMARQLYQLVGRMGPKQPHVTARAGLASTPNRRTIAMLSALQELEAIPDSAPFVSDGLATWLKTLPFIEDDRFMALAEKHAGLLPVPNWHWNLQTAVWAVRQARDVEGDFVELGVFKGHTTLFLAEYLGFADWPKRWLLYDTFEGIPADQIDPGWEGSNQRAYAGTFSVEEVQARFAHIANIHVVKGRVPEILDQGAPERIAFIHMDLNNVTAEIAALDRLFDRLSPGGVILFDDYLWAVSRAQYEAETAWFERRGHAILPLPTGQGVFVKR